MNPGALYTLSAAAEQLSAAVPHSRAPVVRRDAFAYVAGLKRNPTWGPKSLVKKYQESVSAFQAPVPEPKPQPKIVTECDCGLASATEDGPLEWTFCTKCQMSVSRGIRARCKCGKLQPPAAFDVEQWDWENVVDWVDCSGCGLSSHVRCYPKCQDKDRFICLECEYNTDLVYTCTKCSSEFRDEALFARHAFQHGDLEPVPYSVRDAGEE